MHVVPNHLPVELQILGPQRHGDRGVEPGQTTAVDVLNGRHVHLRQWLPGGLFNRLEQVALPRRHEGDRVTGTTCATGATDAVHVGLGVGGDVEIDDMTDPFDIEAAGCDIGRDQDVDLSVLELGDRALALDLPDVAVDRHCREPSRPQFLRQRLGLVLRPDEHDHPVKVLDLKNPGERLDLLRVGHHHVALRGVGRRGRLAGNRDLQRVVEIALGEFADRGGHGRGEQRHALVRGRVRQNRLDVLGEPHVEHLVGLVEHQEAQLGEVQRALVEVVDDPARSAHDHVNASFEGAELGTVGSASVDRQHPDSRQVPGVALECFADLQRQLAGGCQHEGLRSPLLQVQTLQHGQREGGCLAGAGLRQPHDVPALQKRRDRGRLDRARGLVTQIRDRLQKFVAEA